MHVCIVENFEISGFYLIVAFQVSGGDSNSIIYVVIHLFKR